MADLIGWSDALSVGIEEIDQQHQILIGFVNRLHQTTQAGAETPQICAILGELVEYTVAHFALEESLMRIFDYPYYSAHEKEHSALLAELRDLQRQIQQGEMAAGPEAIGLLTRWLIQHMVTDDRSYGPFLLEKGLKPTRPGHSSDGSTPGAGG
jgi:hemerythrin